jgi:hypothetical protein
MPRDSNEQSSGADFPVEWVGIADFDLNGGLDYLLFNATTRRTAVWYLNNNSFASSALGPTAPMNWDMIVP